ncbi:hypothetical protein JTE90_007709 [Oedothorax gibbosus]|uniref:Uncharacterized protein n=1 Tax=Oedothorax gibbosus TaxID=931172 RepID=A0AAV6TM24_9ARAC|nr:hypothetical protein JTE90_007709 [Oedothorax gibbosus]
MEYPNLLKCALENPVLMKAVRDMESETGMLNLVDMEWESKLDNYPVHQLHVAKRVVFSKGHACNQEGAFVRNVALPSHSYKIIVLGSFSGDRVKSKDLDGTPGDMSFVTRDCPPLTTIAQAMAENHVRSNQM